MSDVGVLRLVCILQLWEKLHVQRVEQTWSCCAYAQQNVIKFLGSLGLYAYPDPPGGNGENRQSVIFPRQLFGRPHITQTNIEKQNSSLNIQHCSSGLPGEFPPSPAAESIALYRLWCVVRLPEFRERAEITQPADLVPPVQTRSKIPAKSRPQTDPDLKPRRSSALQARVPPT